MKFHGGPHLSITAGLQLLTSLWPGFNSQAYKLSLNSVEQRPLQPPFVTVSWQMLFGCFSQTVASFLPSARCYQMACFAFSHGCISAAAGSPVSHRVVPHSPPSSASISPNAFCPFGFEWGDIYIFFFFLIYFFLILFYFFAKVTAIF